jgi:hypothetical protein
MGISIVMGLSFKESFLRWDCYGRHDIRSRSVFSRFQNKRGQAPLPDGEIFRIEFWFWVEQSSAAVVTFKVE